MNRILNKLKQNWIKTGIGILVLVLGSYYFAENILPKNLDAKIADCRILGSKYKDKERNKENVEGSKIEFMFPVWTFNKNLDLCLYRSGFYEEEWWNRYIVDLNTNEIVIYSNYRFPSLLDDSDYKYSSGLTTEEFSKKASELFNDSDIFTN